MEELLKQLIESINRLESKIDNMVLNFPGKRVADSEEIAFAIAPMPRPQKQIATCTLRGRCGNEFYQLAQLIAYAKKYDMDYHIPTFSPNTPDNKSYFNIQGTAEARAWEGDICHEPRGEHGPYYVELPRLNNPSFDGYWQSFKYFDEYREDILKAFNLPYVREEKVSIHVRRGDFLQDQNNFPVLPLEYYQAATKYFVDRGYTKFKVFSDDIRWCQINFSRHSFPDCEFEFSEGKTEVEDLCLQSGCIHNIVANSTFSFVAAWLNQNPGKMVLCPQPDRMFTAMNVDMIPEYFTRIHF